jgi:TldD protein
VTPESSRKRRNRPVAIAKANAKLQDTPVQLAPQKGVGEVAWRTPIVKNAFEVPVAEKVALLMEVNKAALAGGANFINSSLFQVNEQKYFASTDGSYIDQDVHRIWPVFNVTGIDPKGGRFQTRQSLGSPCGRGWEYMSGGEGGKRGGIVTRYTDSYDMIADATDAARQVKEKIAAKSVEPGQYTLVLDPSHMYLTIHESIGHPTELDRVLGYEANYAGTSFATIDKAKSKEFKYGSPIVTVLADKTRSAR